MNTSSATTTGWELRFESLYSGRRGYAFPCDAMGQVDMDSLSERALQNYLYARAMMGLEVAWPSVRPSDSLLH
ncbi:MAG TPA: hypothetical protein VLJ19_20555 [Variovorax sp.]|nr:hypothetical protein [Variovorax sp.]